MQNMPALATRPSMLPNSSTQRSITEPAHAEMSSSRLG
jgi:hypothetical protein